MLLDLLFFFFPNFRLNYFFYWAFFVFKNIKIFVKKIIFKIILAGLKKFQDQGIQKFILGGSKQKIYILYIIYSVFFFFFFWGPGGSPLGLQVEPPNDGPILMQEIETTLFFRMGSTKAFGPNGILAYFKPISLCNAHFKPI